jgi:hypothetical protein
MNITLSAPISIGELFDKISILEIKSERILGEEKLKNVNHELHLLRSLASNISLENFDAIQGLFFKLKKVNELIWDAEDTIRACERNQEFNTNFLETARSIYRLNDSRAALKREVNGLTSSELIEEKSYANY